MHDTGTKKVCENVHNPTSSAPNKKLQILFRAGPVTNHMFQQPTTGPNGMTHSTCVNGDQHHQ